MGTSFYFCSRIHIYSRRSSQPVGNTQVALSSKLDWLFHERPEKHELVQFHIWKGEKWSSEQCSAVTETLTSFETLYFNISGQEQIPILTFFFFLVCSTCQKNKKRSLVIYSEKSLMNLWSNFIWQKQMTNKGALAPVSLETRGPGYLVPFLIFLHSFIEGIWTYNKLHKFKLYNLVCFDICTLQ